jgi:hypothetical protein
VLSLVGAFLVTLIFKPEGDQSNIPLIQQIYLRPFVQFFTYISLASLLPFIMKTLTTQESLLSFLKRYYLVVEIVILFAVLQFILEKLGFGFMPILRRNLLTSPTAAFHLGNLDITRVYGITGEPKTLSAFVLPYFIITLYNFLKKAYNRNYYYHLVMLLTSLFVIINAFSSAALISLGLSVLFMVILKFENRLQFIFSLLVIILLFQSLNSNKFILSGENVKHDPNLNAIIFQRTIVRTASEEDQRPEFLSIKFLVEQKPYLMLMGIGMGMYPYFITGGGRYGINPIDSNWVIFLMDFGLIGIVIFLSIIIKMLKLRFSNPLLDNKLYNSCLVGLMSTYFLGLGIGSYQYMMLFMGLTLTILSITKRQLDITNWGLLSNTIHI